MELLDAAERLLNAEGPRVRVEDVVREAGVAKGTFFLYFPTWDDLLEAIRERMVVRFDAKYPLPTELEGPIDWPAVVEAQAEAFIDFALEHWKVGETVFHSDFADRRPRQNNGVTRIGAVIRAGQEAEAFGPVDPEPTARLMFAAIHEAADALAEGEDREATLAALRHLLRRILEP